MGNCLESLASHQVREEKPEEQEEQQKQGDYGKEGGFEKDGGFRVKILLTKEEMDWLLLQLKKKEGKRLEDVLVEIERGRGRSEGWKPSLESIMEGPEVQTIETDCR